MQDANVQHMNDRDNIEDYPRKKIRAPHYTLGATNVTYQQHKTSREERAAVLGRHAGFRGCTIWFTGLSGAGKTTIAFAVEKILTQIGIPCCGLDGDNVRHGLCKNLGFSKEERSENIRRVAEVSKLFADQGLVCLASFISPFRADREEARRIHSEDNLGFFEVYVNTSLQECEKRDPKKLYSKARAGEISGFTGIDSAYEPPEFPELVIDTETEGHSVGRCVETVVDFLHKNGIIPDKAMRCYLGPQLRELFVENVEEKVALLEAAKHMPTIELGPIEVQWLQVLAEGWATPLSGFMRERQYLQALHFGQLLDLKKKTVFPGEMDDGEEDSWPLDEPVNQSIPIVLTITEQQRMSITIGNEIAQQIALTHNGSVLAVLNDGEVFAHRQDERAARQYAFVDARHPGVEQVLSGGPWCLGGDLKVLERITFRDGLDSFRKTPGELRKIFKDKDADAVFVFQLRNPIHNGHALLIRDAREKLLQKYNNPILLLHPLGGWTKEDDVPLSVRIRQHEAVIAEGVLDPSWTVLAIFPSPMLYAGPTEVQWHARARIAAGVQTYIVGRDPAGIQHPDTGDFLYEPTHGAKFVTCNSFQVLSMAPGLSQLQILPFRVAAYDKKSGKMAFFDPSRKDDFDFISGTRMRELARRGDTPPAGFMAPLAWKVLSVYYKSLMGK
ncbi:sulfate adenylyltransferase [Dictyocaulus viviparus]|uniref:Sulfate adenylyltransferase n=1 Tax=Dictyocaulus viviparus TaxID=29172 RepID=A0A0D8XHY5_DICVI|nr:sulfate adenylyltransferase [Dictyocaulus viviparus]